jgi:hypothetical protein
LVEAERKIDALLARPEQKDKPTMGGPVVSLTNGPWA